MAVVYYAATTAVGLTAATAKTLFEIPTPANTTIVIEEFTIGFDATATGNAKIEWGTFTTTGTGTALTPQKWQGDRTIDSAISSGKVADTVEPSGFSQGTLGGTLYPGLIIPLPCYLPLMWPLEKEFAVPESVNFGIRVTSSVTCNVMGYIRWRE